MAKYQQKLSKLPEVKKPKRLLWITQEYVPPSWIVFFEGYNAPADCATDMHCCSWACLGWPYRHFLAHTCRASSTVWLMGLVGRQVGWSSPLPPLYPSGRDCGGGLMATGRHRPTQLVQTETEGGPAQLTCEERKQKENVHPHSGETELKWISQITLDNEKMNVSKSLCIYHWLFKASLLLIV